MAIEGKRLEIVIAALEWWQTKRPDDWDESRHILQPWVNCTDDRERYLAKAVAEYALRRRGPERPTQQGMPPKPRNRY